MIFIKSWDGSDNLHYTDHHCVCFLQAGFSHTNSFISIVPNSCILKATHTHAPTHTCTCSEPDLYLLLYPVSLGTPCPAHMIAPFPGPLLPAFTLFPWQLSFKWVEPLLSARLVKNSFPKSDTGNQLLLSQRFLFLLRSFRCHHCFLSDCRTHLLSTHTYLEFFLKKHTHSEIAALTDSQTDLQKAQRKCSLVNWWGVETEEWYSTAPECQRTDTLLCHVFLTLLRNPCVFDGSYAGHFLPTAGAVQSFISHLHKLRGRTSECEGSVYKCVKMSMCVFVLQWYFHIFLCFPPSCVCLFVFPCVCASTYVYHYTFFLQLLSICDQHREVLFCVLFCCTLTDEVPCLNLAFTSVCRCRRSRINAASATRPSARKEGWMSTWGPTQERNLSNVM